MELKTLVWDLMRSVRAMHLLTSKKAQSQAVAMEEDWTERDPALQWCDHKWTRMGKAHRIVRTPCWGGGHWTFILR